MKIEYIHYVKDQSDFEGDIQRISVESVIHLAKTLTKFKAEHVNWVGAIDNIFTQHTTMYALVFYQGEWNSTEIVDRLIEDANTPYSGDYWPTPFFPLLSAVNSDRTKFVEKLKGDNII
jgi:hypothetical protein